VGEAQSARTARRGLATPSAVDEANRGGLQNLRLDDPGVARSTWIEKQVLAREVLDRKQKA
jgi:hypothetical protein